MAENPKDCVMCEGRGYFRCDCWPGDCICGQDYEECEECGGTGWIDPDDPYFDLHPFDDEETPNG